MTVTSVAYEYRKLEMAESACTGTDPFAMYPLVWLYSM